MFKYECYPNSRIGGLNGSNDSWKLKTARFPLHCFLDDKSNVTRNLIVKSWQRPQITKALNASHELAEKQNSRSTDHRQQNVHLH